MKVPEIHFAEQAKEQYAREEEECNEYISTHSTEMAKCASSLLDMRENLSSFRKGQVIDVLNDNAPELESIGYVRAILDDKEFLMLPSSLRLFLQELSYHILDDGVLHITRIEVFDDIKAWLRDTGREWKAENWTIVSYAIWEGEDTKEDIGESWIRRNDYHLHMPRVVSLRTVSFRNIRQFARVLETLAEPGNYDDYDMLKNGVLDFMFEPMA